MTPKSEKSKKAPDLFRGKESAKNKLRKHVWLACLNLTGTANFLYNWPNICMSSVNHQGVLYENTGIAAHERPF
jgi:hypothetical protein